MGIGGGSKGQSSQQQTYSPNPAATSAITGALGQAQGAASLPFNVPVAPVAGFSNDQQTAFGNVNNAQGYALPYFNQGANYVNQSAQGPNIGQFFNPFASAVGANLADIFGQQQSQTTGQLTQAAGGAGADRIAVGQSELAKQQGLTAGQTFASLFQPSLSAAQNEQGIMQNAGTTLGAIGGGAQGSILQGAQAQLGTGGLQQQLQQAQMNAPYQWDVARAAFPYQQSNFLTNAVGSLAPGLGGTTSGTATPAQPSIYSQILGAGALGLGAVGLTGGFGSNGYVSNLFNSNAQPNTAAMNNSMNTLNNNKGGDFFGPGFARGGEVGPYHFDDGGAAPGGSNFMDFNQPASDKPINIASQGIIPQTQSHPIQPHIPQLQQQSGGSGGKGSGGLGDIASIASAAAKIAPLLAARRGGRIEPDKFDGFNPYSIHESRFPDADHFASGGVPHYDDGGDVTMNDRFQPVQQAIDDGTFDRSGANTFDNDFLGAPIKNPPLPRSRPTAAGGVFTPTASNGLPPEITAGRSSPPDDTSDGSTQMLSLTDDGSSPKVKTQPAGGAGGGDAPDAAASAGDLNSGYQTPIPSKRKGSMVDNPWMAVAAAGLGMLGGSSPFAGVNIGQGGMQGIKVLQQQRDNAHKDETVDQSWRRLEQEAKFHADSVRQADRPYNEMTKAQAEHNRMEQEKHQLEMTKPFKIGQDTKTGIDIMGVRDPKNPGHFLHALTGEPVNPADVKPGSGPAATPPAVQPGQQPGASAPPDGILNAHAQVTKAGPFDYSNDALYIEKGMDVPEPESVGGRSTRAIQQDAETFIQTGKLPNLRGVKGPVAMAERDYRNAVQNYGNALLQSRGLSPQEATDMWRSAPGMLRFILGADGRATVSLGTGVRHLDTLKQYIDAFKASDVPTMRALQATISREFGQTAATNIDAAASIVGPEIVKAIGVAGAGTKEDREHAISLFKGGTAQATEAIQVVERLLSGQLEGKMRQAHEAGVSDERFKRLVGERPFEVLRNMEKSPPGSTSEKPPAAAAKTVVQTGTVLQGPNQGKTAIKYSDGTIEYR